MIFNGIEIGDEERDPGEHVASLAARHHRVPKSPSGEPMLTKAVELGDRAPLSPVEMKSFADALGIPWVAGYEDRVVAWWGSDSRVDRDGDIMVPEGWRLENYKSNPVHLWDHDWSSVPIGMSLRTEVLQRGTDFALALDILYPNADVWPTSESILRLVRSGFLRTGSVGFLPKKVINVTDESARASLGLGRYGVVIAEAELVEFSATPVPSNVGAMVAGLRSAKGLVASDANIVREFGRVAAIAEGKGQDEWRAMDAAIRSAWSLFFPGEKFPDAKSIDRPIEIEPAPTPALEVFGVVERTDEGSELLRRLDNIEALMRELHSAEAKSAPEDSASSVFRALADAI